MPALLTCVHPLDGSSGQRYALYYLIALLLEVVLCWPGIGEFDPQISKTGTSVENGECGILPVARQLRGRLLVPLAQLQIPVGVPL